jgi:hypothetical protein
MSLATLPTASDRAIAATPDAYDAGFEQRWADWKRRGVSRGRRAQRRGGVAIVAVVAVGLILAATYSSLFS